MPQETIVATLSGQTEEDRLVVVLCQYAAGANALELRQQSWGDGVGWFTQSTVEMSPRQVANLRNALGGSPGGPPLPDQLRRVSEGHWQPRVTHADSA